MKNTALPRLCLFVLLFYIFSLKTVGQSISGVVNSYYKVIGINTVTNSLTVLNPVGITPGVRVLLIQMKGATINNTNTTSFGNITALNNAGLYEFNTVCSIAANTVVLQQQLLNSYDLSGSLQLVTVPMYSTVTVTDTLKSNPWNGNTGGVVAIEADAVNLNSGIDVSGQGFAGGVLTNFPTPTYDCVWSTDVQNYFLSLTPTPNQYYCGGYKGEGIAAYITNEEYGRGKQANGGGGGNNHNTGGGGGSNYGAGGIGGQRSHETFFLCHGLNPGIGGLSLSTLGYSTGTNNRIFFGGGGGAGHENNSVGMPGGAGGGIVIITANTINAAGTTINANGAVPFNSTNTLDIHTAYGDGGGGGGAGGTIILNTNQVTGSIIASASGANGSDAGLNASTNDCAGPGGGGGGGVVWMKGSTTFANVITYDTAGHNGVNSTLSNTVACRGITNGALSGSAGASLANYIEPFSAAHICEPLAIPDLRSFTARQAGSVTDIQWNMSNIFGIASYTVERSIDHVNFVTVASRNNDGSLFFIVTDKDPQTGTINYRLKILYKDGKISYSSIVVVRKNATVALQWLSLFPNPASHQLKLTVVVKQSIPAEIGIFTSAGQQVSSKRYVLTAGYSTIVIPITELQPGVYWLVTEALGMKSVKGFVKK